MKNLVLVVGYLLCSLLVKGQRNEANYSLSIKSADAHVFGIAMDYVNIANTDTVDFYLPRWTPGYYQIMDFGQRLRNFKVTDRDGTAVPFREVGDSHWKVYAPNGTAVHVQYDMQEDKNFVAESYVNAGRAYILPTNLFVYSKDIQYGKTINVHISKYSQWPDVYGAGLALLRNDPDSWTFHAQTLDDFYDSPILIGKLDTLPTFYIKDVPHQFVGYAVGHGDYTERLMGDMQKIISRAIDIFGDIPYSRYVFLGIGPGRGGIEHLNSASVSFDGDGIKNQQDYLRTLSFLAHEYFHNFNVKRIRPVELGPFDYQNPNRTRQLWISEGLSVYYEHWLLWKTGLFTYDQYLQTFADAMDIYENKPGHLIQSLASSSWNTWSDGPFGNLSDTAISYYDKGPVVGLLFDCAIKHCSKGRYSLESVMRYLYDNYYKKLGRGFTEAEFREVAIRFGTKEILPLFDYIYTAKPVDYNRYLHWEGLKVVKTKHGGKWEFKILQES
ncbi:MAG: hypothetical protein QM610_09105 [Chitinophagaceae bacterium]